MPNCLKYFGAELVQQNAVFWMKSLMQTFNSKPRGQILELVLDCVHKLLPLSIEFDDISRDFALNLIHPFLTTLTSCTYSETEFLENRLMLYRQSIICYPGPTGRFRNQIESHCLSLVGHNIDSVRLKASKCLAVIPQCGTSGEKGTKFAEFWNKQFGLTLNTIRELVEGFLLSKDEKGANQNSPKLTLKLPKILLAQPHHSITLSRQITSLILVLEGMLTYKFPSMVNLTLQPVISLCLKIFSKQVELENSSIEAACVNVILPQLWGGCLSLMNTIVIQIGSLALPYQSSISNMVFETLSFAQKDGKAYNEHPRIKMCAYKLMKNWISFIGEIDREVISKIVDLIFHDIKQVMDKENSVTNPANVKQKKQKHGKRLHEDIVESAMAGKMVDRTENSYIAMAALDLLETLIKTSGSRMILETIQKIESFVVSVCIAISEPLRQAASSFPAPYGSAQCRKQILKCAFSLLNLYHHQLPTPASTFISIFRYCLNDPSFSVLSDCRHYLYLSDKILHPSVPALRVYDKCSGASMFKTKSTGFLGENSSVEFVDIQNSFIPNLTSHASSRTELADTSHSHEIDNLETARDICDTSSEKVSSLVSINIPALESYTRSNSDTETKKESVAEIESDVCMETEDEFPSSAPQKDLLFEKAQVGAESYINEMKESISDDHPENDGLEAKRPKLDNRLMDEKNENSPEIQYEHSTLINKVGVEGKKIVELSENVTSAEETTSNGDDETTVLLKSFVNSYPDSD